MASENLEDLLEGDQALQTIRELSKELQNIIKFGGDLSVISKEMLEIAKSSAKAGTTEKQLQKAIDKTVRSLKSALSSSAAYNALLDQTSRKLNKMGGEQDRVLSSISKSMSGFKNLNSALKDIKEEIGRVTNLSEEYKKQLEGQADAIAEAVKEERKHNLIKKRTAIVEAKLARETEVLTSKLKRQSKQVGALGSDLNGLVAGFGGTAISMKGAIDTVTKYNQSMFDLRRTLGVFGQTTGDLEQAFRTVSKETTFSKQQFADFANEISSGYASINLTATEIADFASVLQGQFGPNVEVAKEKGLHFVVVILLTLYCLPKVHLLSMLF